MAQESRLVIVIDAKNAERNARNLGNELDNIERKGDFASKSMDGLSVATRQLAGYMAGLVTISASVSKIDAYTNMSNRLKLVTNSQAELNQALDDTFKIAQNSRAAWDGVIQVYQRFSDNAKTLGINMQKTAELTDTVSKAVAISGASAQAAEAALTQFGQALASGQLRGEELNSILEQTPALAKAIAQGMGITVGELRSVAAEGKITGEVLVDALTKAKSSVDELFSRTDMTIAQSITVLNNEVTKFVGEAGKGSGAANALAGSIQLLAENVSLIADVALAAGIGYITKAIITKTVAVEATVAASVAARAANIAEAESELKNAIAATNDAKAHLASTKETLASTQAKYGATAASARYTTAQAALTAATNAQTLAQDKLNKATSLFSRVGGAALALAGGPIGILAIAIGGAAFAFSKMSEASEEANKKLLETSKYAKLSAEELDKLEGSQKRAAKDDLQKSFEEKNKRLKELSMQFNATVIDMQNYAKGNVEVAKISNDVRQGFISQEEAIKRLNKLDLFTGEQIQAAETANQKYRELLPAVNADEKALKIFGVTVKLSGNAAENAAFKVDSNTKSLDDNASAALGAAQAQSEYIKKLQQTAVRTGTVNKLIERGYDPERAKALAEAYFEGGNKITSETVKLVDLSLKENKKLEDSIAAVSRSRSEDGRVARSEAKRREKEIKEEKRLIEDMNEERKAIAYQYSSEETQKAIDLQKEITRLQQYGQEQYISIARTRYEEERKLAKMNFEYDLVEFRVSEEQKLRFLYNIKEQEIIADTKLTKEQTQQKLASLKIQFKQEMYDIELAKDQRLFAATEFQYGEMERIQKRYELERRELGKIHDEKERAALQEASRQKQNQEEAAVRDKALADFAGVMGYEENPLIKQFEILDEIGRAHV